MTNSVCWHSHVLGRALDLEVEGQRKKCKLTRTWKKQVEEDALCRLKWVVDFNLFTTRLM